MKVLAELGKLSETETLLAVKDAYPVDFVVAHNYDPDKGDWSWGDYLGSDLNEVAEVIRKANPETRKNTWIITTVWNVGNPDVEMQRFTGTESEVMEAMKKEVSRYNFDDEDLYGFVEEKIGVIEYAKESQEAIGIILTAQRVTEMVDLK